MEVYPLVIMQKASESYWKLPFLADLPINSMVIFHSFFCMFTWLIISQHHGQTMANPYVLCFVVLVPVKCQKQVIYRSAAGPNFLGNCLCFPFACTWVCDIAYCVFSLNFLYTVITSRLDPFGDGLCQHMPRISGKIAEQSIPAV